MAREADIGTDVAQDLRRATYRRAIRQASSAVCGTTREQFLIGNFLFTEKTRSRALRFVEDCLKRIRAGYCGATQRFSPNLRTLDDTLKCGGRFGLRAALHDYFRQSVLEVINEPFR